MKPNLLLSATFLTASVFALCSCDGSRTRKMSGMVWHTEYHVTYESDRDLNDSIISVLDKVGASLNTFDSSSVVGHVNATDTVKVDKAFEDVYNESVRIHRLSGGAFDPTLGPLITAWGFGKGHKATSDTLRLDSLLNMTGILKTRIVNHIIYKGDSRVQFNFSAIAKGYGADEVGKMLQRNGADSYLVEIGGEISCQGRSPSGSAWRVSVDRPIATDSVIHDSQCIVEISDCGLATSGNYRNYHRADDGSIYGHTISASTGRPSRTDVLSATVVAPTCMEADGLATAMMALGSKDAKELAASLGYPVMLILPDTKVWQNDEFKAILKN